MTPTQTAIAVATLATKLGQVRRVTAHPDGEPESVTTHTVMLCLLALSLRGLGASEDADPATLLIFALVHDLVEAYCGDTDTSTALDADGYAAKRAREHEALLRVRRELPEIGAWIAGYEAMTGREAAMVHILDKMCPRLTHILDGGASLRRRGWTADQLRARNAQQLVELTAQHPTQVAALALFAELSAMSEAAMAAATGYTPEEDAEDLAAAQAWRELPDPKTVTMDEVKAGRPR